MNRPPNRNVILAGGSGFLGRHLQQALSDAGYSPVVLTRNPEQAGNSRGGRLVKWDAGKFTGWEKEVDGAAAIINLAGKSVNCRDTKANRREIVRSRINSVRALAEAVRRCENPPPVWIQAGSLAVYGDAGPLWCDETAPAGEGFPVETCRKWEDTFFSAALPASTRRVLLRIGMVLGNDGGALPVLDRLARAFAGGTAGGGRQFISWLHVEDMNRIVLQTLGDSALQGIFNACTAGPVTNAEFMRDLRRLHRRPWSPPAPALLVKTAAWLLNSGSSLLLTGRRGLPGRLMEAGFRFRYPALRPALEELLFPPAVAPQFSPAPTSVAAPALSEKPAARPAPVLEAAAR